MTITAEVVECRGAYYVKCKNREDAVAFYVDSDFKTYHNINHVFHFASFVSEDSANRVKDGYLELANTLSLLF